MAAFKLAYQILLVFSPKCLTKNCQKSSPTPSSLGCALSPVLQPPSMFMRNSFYRRMC